MQAAALFIGSSMLLRSCGEPEPSVTTWWPVQLTAVRQKRREWSKKALPHRSTGLTLRCNKNAFLSKNST